MSRVKRGWVELDINNADSILAGDIVYSDSFTVEEAIDNRLGVSEDAYSINSILSVGANIPKTKTGHGYHNTTGANIVQCKDSGKSFCSDGSDIPVLESASSSIIPTQKEVSRRFKQSIGIKTSESVLTDSIMFAYSHDTVNGDSFRLTQLVNGRSTGLKIRSTGSLGATNDYIPTEDLIKNYIDTTVTTSTSHLIKNTSYSSEYSNYLVLYNNATSDTVKVSSLEVIDITKSFFKPSLINNSVKTIPTLMFCQKETISGIDYFCGTPYTQDSDYVIFKGSGSLSSAKYVIPSEYVIINYIDDAIDALNIGSLSDSVSRSSDTGGSIYIPLWINGDVSTKILANESISIATTNSNWPSSNSIKYVATCQACDERFLKIVDGVSISGTKTKNIAMWYNSSTKLLATDSYNIKDSSDDWTDSDSFIPTTQLITNHFVLSSNVKTSSDDWTDSDSFIPTTQLITNHFIKKGEMQTYTHWVNINNVGAGIAINGRNNVTTQLFTNNATFSLATGYYQLIYHLDIDINDDTAYSGIFDLLLAVSCNDLTPTTVNIINYSRQGVNDSAATGYHNRFSENGPIVLYLKNGSVYNFQLFARNNDNGTSIGSAVYHFSISY